MHMNSSFFSTLHVSKLTKHFCTKIVIFHTVLSRRKDQSTRINFRCLFWISIFFFCLKGQDTMLSTAILVRLSNSRGGCKKSTTATKGYMVTFSNTNFLFRHLNEFSSSKNLAVSKLCLLVPCLLISTGPFTGHQSHYQTCVSFIK